MCSERSVDTRVRMTTFSQLETVQKKIDDLDAKILNTEAALAATQSATDIDFLRKQLERYKEKIVRCEQETILLQGQASGVYGVYCLPRYLLPLSCLSFLQTC